MVGSAGVNRVFTGTPCRNGHICERILSTGKCVECHKANKLRYEAAHPDRSRARNQRWQERNRDKVRAHCANWAAKNKEKIRAYSAQHYEKCRTSPDVMKARSEKSKRWNRLNPEKHNEASSKWQSSNPQKVVAIQATRRARKVGAEGKFTKADIDRLLRLQGHKCALSWCRKPLDGGHHVDHVVPLALGGSNGPNNIQMLCPTCNRKKWAKHPIEFAQENGMLL